MPAALSIVNRLKPGGTGSQTYTDRGFPPACVVDFVAASFVLDAFASAYLSLGFTAPTAGGAVTYSNTDGDAQPEGHSGIWDDAFLTGASTATCRAKQTGAGPLGEILNWTTVTAGQDFAALAIGGDGVQAAVGEFDLPTAGTVTVSGLPFQPTFILMAHELRSSFGGTASGGRIGYGFSNGTDDRAVACLSPLGLSANEKSVYRDDAVTCDVNAWRSPLSSVTADGFTLTPDVYPASAIQHVYLALAGVGTVTVGTETQKTTTGVKSTATGNVPTLVLLIGAATTSVNTTRDNTDLCLGLITDQHEAAAWAGAQDAVGNANTSSLFTLTKSAYVGNYGGTLNSEADGATTATGFELDWTTTDGTARQFGWAALEVPGAVAVLGGGNRWWWWRGY